jgi:glycine betaine/proline transport system ATP-binding protein
VFQDPFSTYNPIFKADRIFAMVREQFFPGVRASAWEERIDSALADVRLDPAQVRNKYPHQLSGGQQQRVGLGRALAADPEVLLFDEPFSALDPLIRRDMQEEVIRLRREEGCTMVFITHDLSEALRVGDRIALMRDGEIVQLGTPEQIVAEPADDYVADFVRDVPREQVISVRSAMRPATAAESLAGAALSPGTLVIDAIEAVARTGEPVRVMEGEHCLGVVDHAGLLSIVAGIPTTNAEDAGGTADAGTAAATA